MYRDENKYTLQPGHCAGINERTLYPALLESLFSKLLGTFI